MSRKPETTFRLSVERHLPPIRALYRMKNSSLYTAGVADSWYSADRQDLWVEWKYLILPKRLTTEVLANVSPLQSEWLTLRYNEGRNVAVILGCPDGGVVYKDLSWGVPLTCGEYRARLQTRKQLANWLEGEVCLGSTGSREEQQRRLTFIGSCSRGS